MKKNKALVLGPITADSLHLEALRKPLDFLSRDYDIEILDPLMFDADARDFYPKWQKKLTALWPDFELIIGFSFGGMILLDFLAANTVEQKSILLFSAPAFSDDALKAKLGQVIHDCEQQQLSRALDTLYAWVYAPGQALEQSLPQDQRQACRRLISGLKRVIDTDLRTGLQNISQPFLHFYGECSELVGRAQLGDCPEARLVEVRQSSMRVLEDQPGFCQQRIWDYLSE